MSKLDGNERWKSKMMLTDHVELYDQQHTTIEKKIITNEELTMIRDYILLPHMETMVQKSIDEVQYSTNILKRLYLMASQKILNQIMQDKYKLRRELKRRNIRVFDEEQSDFIIYHKYYCRGYEDQFGMTRDVMKAEISIQLTNYMAELTKLLKEENTKGIIQ